MWWRTTAPTTLPPRPGQAGAFVYERFDQKHKGKGYAIDYLFRRLKEERKDVYERVFCL